MCVIRNAVYHGKCKIGTKVCYVFRLNQRVPKNRYIWLSLDDKSFWNDPIIPDRLDEHEKIREAAINWPHILYFQHGIIKSSAGSVFGANWSQNQREIHTLHSPLLFDDYHRLHMRCSRSFNQVRNYITGIMATQKINFHRLET